ncbi:exonuclease SbcCD subunit D [Nanoarchaeota archaeon]
MKFAHMADCHIGSWRDPKLKEISTEAFIRAIDMSVQEKVDFILISGDLFNTPLPSMDTLKKTVVKLKELKDLGIPLYLIAGSHDYSPSGKTMLDVLEGAGLVRNVLKGTSEDGKLKLNFTVDEKTGAKITGLLGKRLGLEKTYYENLMRDHLEQEEGYKIFLFHSGIDEIKSKNMEKVITNPLSLLPKNFNYYAGGHIHEVSQNEMEGYGKVVFPGPLFPNNFKELEDLGGGGFFIVENNEPKFQSIQVYNTHSIKLDCNHKNPQQVYDEVIDNLKDQEFNNTIVTIRLFGTLSSGKGSDIDFKRIYDYLYNKSAYFVMKNTSALTSEEFEQISLSTDSIDDVEDSIIKEHLGQIKIDDLKPNQEAELVKNLMESLKDTREEGERVTDFEDRISKDISKILKID